MTLKEQRAEQPPIKRRASAFTAPTTTPVSRQMKEPVAASRYYFGHSAGMHPEDQPYQTSERDTARGTPPRERSDRHSLNEEEYTQPTMRMPTSARRWLPTLPAACRDLDLTGMPNANPPRRFRPHWTLRFGAILMSIALGSLLLQVGATWTQHALDTWHYGMPRTYQTDAVVGHGDSLAHPSHFIGLNLNGHIEVIELPGGDPSRARLYAGPTLSGPDRSEVPVVVTFEDVNHNGKPEMILQFAGLEVIYRNTGTTFQPESHP
jgi:hypothetical protein